MRSNSRDSADARARARRRRPPAPRVPSPGACRPRVRHDAVRPAAQSARACASRASTASASSFTSGLPATTVVALAHREFDDWFLRLGDEFDAVAFQRAEQDVVVAAACGAMRPTPSLPTACQRLVHADSPPSPVSRIIAGMRAPYLLALWACLALAPAVRAADGDDPMISIAIHGGAGVISRSSMTEEAERAYRADLGRALDAGYAVLDRAAPVSMRPSPPCAFSKTRRYFNAGHGSVFSHAASTNSMLRSWTARRRRRARSPACATCKQSDRACAHGHGPHFARAA